MKNDKQNAVDWLVSQLQRSKDWYRVLNEINFMTTAEIDIIQQAREIYKDSMEEVIIKRCAVESTLKASSYSDGYKAGYERALELVKWKIDNELNTRPIKCQQ